MPSNTMIWPNYLGVILPAAFSTIHALHLPIPTNQTVGSPSKLASGWECTFIPRDIPPGYVDCCMAYIQLPHSETRETFHDTGEEDGYKLPVKRSYNTCALTVSFLGDGGQQDISSWAEIVFKARILNDLCVNGRDSGGYYQTGQYGRIRVELESAKVPNWTLVAGGQVDVI